MPIVVASLLIVALAVVVAFVRRTTPASNDFFDFAGFLLIVAVVLAAAVKLTPWARWKSNSLLTCLAVAMTLQVVYEPFYHMWHSLDWARFYIHIDNQGFWRRALLALHILGALASTFLGPLLFIRWWRSAHPHHHRFMGKIYVFGTLFSAVMVLPLALTNAGGTAAQIGFSTMAILWFTFTWLAYTSVRCKDFVSHRRWMMRSYALTFAFVHVNFSYKILDIYAVLELGPVGAKVMQSMVSWMINLVLVEIYLAATTASGKFLGLKGWWNNLQNMEFAGNVYWWVDETHTGKINPQQQSTST